MDIRGMRMRLGDTQSEFAARYHIPRRTIQNWETGARKPPEYIISLLEYRIQEDLINRKTTELPKYDPQKRDLPQKKRFCRSDILAQGGSGVYWGACGIRTR